VLISIRKCQKISSIFLGQWLIIDLHLILEKKKGFILQLLYNYLFVRALNFVAYLRNCCSVLLSANKSKHEWEREREREKNVKFSVLFSLVFDSAVRFRVWIRQFTKTHWKNVCWHRTHTHKSGCAFYQ